MHPILDALEASARRSETAFGGGRIVWHEWGDGPPLLLLHGGAGSWRHWARTIPFLARSRRVLAPDTPGLGESDPPPPGAGLWEIAGALAEGLRQQAGGTPADLVGFSFGAVIAAHLAAAHGALLDSVTLVGCGALGLRRDPTPLLPVRDRHGAERLAAHRANLASLMLADPAAIDELALAIQAWNSDHARLRSRKVVGEAAVRDLLPRIERPLAVIYGERDAIAYPYMEERIRLFAELCPAAPLRIIPGAGHWVAFEAAEAFNATLAALLPLEAAAGG
ncbi:alpha/beta fold hydrolase [Roseomonas sp. USHLN139]|uniref:alpha/beta fold hydrolase n=1 Tax=Roseomonas sp. USHLN139 TaxID=3081298 RepID=UPI003B017CE0